LEGQNVLTQLSSFLVFVTSIHVARHVDVDGIGREGEISSQQDLYAQSVDNARVLVRTLEAVVQSLFDSGAAFLMTVQSVHHVEPSESQEGRQTSYSHLDTLSVSLKENLHIVQQTLVALLTVGHSQADMAQGEYNGSIEWRMSRLSMIDNQFGGVLRPASNYLETLHHSQVEGDEDIVDFDFAFRNPGSRHQDTLNTHDESLSRNASQISQTTVNASAQSRDGDSVDVHPSWSTSSHTDTSPTTLMPKESPDDVSALKLDIDRNQQPSPESEDERKHPPLMTLLVAN
jgi:son of sevenless-like protein